MPKVRTTVTIDEEALAVYRQLAETLGVSLTRAIGGWLEESTDAAQMVALNVRAAKESPAKALREISRTMAFAEGQASELQREVRQLLKKANGHAAGGKRGGGAPASPPASRRSARS